MKDAMYQLNYRAVPEGITDMLKGICLNLSSLRDALVTTVWTEEFI